MRRSTPTRRMQAPVAPRMRETANTGKDATAGSHVSIRRAVTLRDVAAAAQVDPSTASRALRSSTRGQVRADTAERVLATAHALGYRVNALAKGLKAQRSMTVGMLLPDLANPLFPPIVRGIEDGLRKAKYALILANTDRDPNRERALLDVLLERRIDGLLLATAEREYPLLAEVIAHVPTVLVNRRTDQQVTSSVASDDYQGVGRAIRHLVELGHTRIAHIGGNQTVSTGRLRYEYYAAWMRELGVPVDPDLVVFSGWFTQDLAAKACAELLDRASDVTAIFAASDLIALGCYRVLRARGLRVPEDVSVVGYNGIQLCEEFCPPLTTVHVPKYDIGRHAATLMLATIEDPDSAPASTLLPTSFQLRQSTAPVRGK